MPCRTVKDPDALLKIAGTYIEAESKSLKVPFPFAFYMEFYTQPLAGEMFSGLNAKFTPCRCL